MLGAFPEATCVPFAVTADTFAAQKPIDAIQAELARVHPPAPAAAGGCGAEHDDFWKCFVVYVCGQGYAAAEDTIKELQKLHPGAAIIGGICQAGDVRKAAPATTSQKQGAGGGHAGGGGAQKEEEEEDASPSVSVEDIDTLVANMTVRQLKNEILAAFGRAALVGITEKDELRAKAKVSVAKQRVQAMRMNKLKQSAERSRVQHVESGIIGMALGGNVPLRSVVSRGVQSCYTPAAATSSGSSHSSSSTRGSSGSGSGSSMIVEAPPTVWSVDKAILASPGDDAYPYRIQAGDEDSYKPVWLVSRVAKQVDGGGGGGGGVEDTDELSEDADGVTSQHRGAREFLMEPYHSGRGRPDYVGIRKVGQDGFTLHQLHQGMVTPRGIVIDADEGDYVGDDATTSATTTTTATTEQENSILGAAIDVFSLDGASCIRDLDVTLARLHRQLNGEQLLGALMFSCGGRGPSRGSMMGEAMCDATHFEGAFPGLPCLGFYAGGEIGPMAIHGNVNVFQSGKVALQGFTAVFGVFVVPIPKEISRFDIDDSPQRVAAAVQLRLMRPSGGGEGEEGGVEGASGQGSVAAQHQKKTRAQ